MFALTYHQVMPAFLDFVFPFGKQQYTQDFHFSGFRHEDRLSTARRGLDIQELGRTGRDIRMCYGLKSVEPSRARDDWPWSIRQTATYHSLDIKTGKSLWIIIKADQLIKRRMEAATKPRNAYRIDSFGSTINALSSSLSTHLILFDWCSENWRWYINFLEQALENTTRRTRLIRFDTPTRVTPKNAITMQGNQDLASSSLTTEKTGLSLSSQRTTRPPRRAPQEQPPPTTLPELTANSVLAAEQSNGEADFSFSDLQQVQFFEEKANEILLVLEANINVISELKEHYQEVVASEDFPYVLRQECAGDIKRFQQGIASTVSDLRMHYSRTKTLLQTLTDRKGLVSFLCLSTLTLYLTSS